MLSGAWLSEPQQVGIQMLVPWSCCGWGQPRSAGYQGVYVCPPPFFAVNPSGTRKNGHFFQKDPSEIRQLSVSHPSGERQHGWRERHRTAPYCEVESGIMLEADNLTNLVEQLEFWGWGDETARRQDRLPSVTIGYRGLPSRTVSCFMGNLQGIATR